jgi:hypothetical protein
MEIEEETIQPKPIAETITPLIQRQEEVGEEEDIKELKRKIKKLVDSKFGGDYKKAFTHYDENNNKSINAEELEKLLKDADVGNWATRSRWVSGIIKRLDTNKNGEIEWSEFNAVIKESEKKTTTVQPKLIPEQIAPMIQRQAEPDEEEEESIQTKLSDGALLQRQEEEPEEEEEEEPIQAKQAGGQTAHVGPGLNARINSMKGGGQPLTRSVRDFFEPRFGHDFSGVRVHNDAKAADTAHAVSARAFTVGRDIIFGNGQYAPDTKGGRRLMAHELAHVVQQNGGDNVGLKRVPIPFPRRTIDGSPRIRQLSNIVVQRAASDFRIKGLTPDAASFPRMIFFDLAEATITGSELAKITVLSSAAGFNTTDLTLKGLASEEGTASFNMTLANNRISSVDSALSAAGHTATRTPLPEPSAGLGRIEYRKLRAVEIIPAGSTSSVPPARAVVPCAGVTGYPAQFTNAITEGKRLLSAGITALGASPRTATTNALLRRFFGSHSDAKAIDIGSRMVDLKTHVGNMTAMTAHQCVNVCTNTLASNQGHGATAMMTLCPQFFSSSLGKRAGTLVHEGAHGTSSIMGSDHAYAHHRLITFLTPAQSKENPDSFVLFLQVLDGGTPTVGRPSPDVVTGMTVAEELKAHKALAWLEKYLTSTYLQVATMYRRLDTHRAAGATWPAGFYRDVMGYTAARFGLTAPPAVRTSDRRDQIRVATIHDRFRTMRQVFWGVVNINKSSPTKWQIGPGRDVDVASAFFGLGSLVQVTQLLTALVNATRGISSGLEPQYVGLLDEIRRRLGIPDPPP